jgi:hypothetical protein
MLQLKWGKYIYLPFTMCKNKDKKNKNKKRLRINSNNAK